MEIQFAQNFYYSNKEHLPIGDVANALLALEKTSKPIAGILEKLFEDVIVKDIWLEVDELHSGSLTERIRYYVNVALQKHVEKESGLEFKSLDGVDDAKKTNVVAWAATAALLLALKLAADRAWPSKPKQHIEQQINITMEAGRDITGIDVKTLRTQVEAAVLEEPESVRGAVEFTKPAKRDPSAQIMLDEQSFLTQESLREVPSSLLPDEEQEKVIELEETEIHIRATDRDSGKRGWGASIPEFSPRRLRMHVAPGINLEFLAHCDVVVGNVAVFYTVDSHGNISKPHAHLYSIDRKKTEALSG